jgi:hypothetical protein
VQRTLIASCLVSAMVSASLTLILVAWLGPRSTTSSVITAQRFEVVDQDGKLKAYLGGPPYNDSLVILDPDGIERIRLTVLADNTAVFLMSDAERRIRARIYVNRQGASALDLYGEDGRPVHSLAAPAFTTVPR